MTMHDIRGGSDYPQNEPGLQKAFDAMHRDLTRYGHVALSVESDIFTADDPLPEAHEVEYQMGIGCLGKHVIAFTPEAAKVFQILPDDAVTLLMHGTLEGPLAFGLNKMYQGPRRDPNLFDGADASDEHEVSHFTYYIDMSDEGPSTGIDGQSNMYDRQGKVTETVEYDSDAQLTPAQVVGVSLLATYIQDINKAVIDEGLDGIANPYGFIPNN